MANPSQAMQYVCRSCRQTLSRAKPVATRTFTTTPFRSKSIPSFQPTSSTEFDALLGEWRQKVFMPSALSAHHQALVYKVSRHPILENDPGVTVTMSDNEEVQLEPMFRFDRPNKSKSLGTMAAILGGSPDAQLWSNLPPFLEGMHLANERVPQYWLEKVTRKANEQGKQGIVLRCAEMVKKTRFHLSYAGVTRELLIGCHMRAAGAGFKGDELRQAVRTADRVIVLMNEPEHCAGKLRRDQADMRRDVGVVGVLLELNAARALDQNDGKDVDGAVRRYVDKLVSMTEEPGTLLKTHGITEHPLSALEDWVPLANAIRLALKVDGLADSPERLLQLKQKLKSKLTQLDDAIKQNVEKAKTLENVERRRGWQMMQKVQSVST